VEDPFKHPKKWFSPLQPASKVRRLFIAMRFRPKLYYDNLPVGRYRVKQFLLTNVGGRASPATGNFDEFGDDYLNTTEKEETTPQWTLTVHSYEASWDNKEKDWQHGKWAKEETIDVCFREPFHVLSRGDDYFFLTASGKLYRAARPTKGKHRKVETVWSDTEAPIKAFIADVDRGRTFLFCDKGPRGVSGPCVFEMASGARPRFYDRTLFKPSSQGPERLRRVVGYSRVLLALGYLKSDSGKR
jgi:hypothetical protein